MDGIKQQSNVNSKWHEAKQIFPNRKEFENHIRDEIRKLQIGVSTNKATVLHYFSKVRSTLLFCLLIRNTIL